MPFRVVTFYTSGEGGGGYEEEFVEWRASVEAQGYPWCAKDVGPIPEWRAATMEKPKVCLEAYRELPEGWDLVWVDADARLNGRLPLFEQWGDEDLGARMFMHNPGMPKGELLSGTLFFKGGRASVLYLLEVWTEQARLAAVRDGSCAGVPGDQNVLQACVEQGVSGLRVKWLPPEYCWIFDLDLKRGGKSVDPLVEHFQASRRRRSGRGYRGFVTREEGWRRG